VRHEAVWSQIGDVESRRTEQILASGECSRDETTARDQSGADGGEQHDPTPPAERLNGWPHQYTMARFVEGAFTAQLERLKIEYNGGQEFPDWLTGTPTSLR